VTPQEIRSIGIAGDAAAGRDVPRSVRWFVCALAFFLTLCCATSVRAQDTNSSDDTATVDNSTNAPAEDDNTSTYHAGSFRVEVEGHRVPIIFRKDVVVRTNETAEMVVVIGGSAKVLGNVRENVVVIGGDIELDGKARDVVAVLGGIRLGPDAKVQGDVAAIGGALEIADGAQVHRRPFEMDLGGLAIGAREWVLHGLFNLRPFPPQVGWVWMMTFFFFLIYLIVALIMQRPVRACADELGRRPATTFLMGILTMMLVPFIFVILAATGVGAVIIPFIAAAVAFGALIGKTALYEALGFGIGNRFGAAVLKNPLLAFLVGFLVITGLYMVPIIGFLALGVIGVWGLGGAVTAAAGSLRRESPAVVAAGGASPSSGPPQYQAASASPAPGSAGLATPASGSPGSTPTEPAASASASTHAAMPATPANIPEAFTQRRANFWERMGAGFLDWVIVGILGGLVNGPPFGFLVALAYFAGMWAWKGTTLGGIVLGLKVVRLDGQQVTFVVALVRALACLLSLFVFFLGFLWIIWDREKQGWHDRIAGTVVVRMNKSMPLVCL
jgi:uncharacterized RDD family membrane protein YckC